MFCIAECYKAYRGEGVVRPAKPEKNNQFTARVPEDLKADVERECEKTGIDPSTLIRACLKAFVDEVQRSGEIVLPLALTSKRRLKELEAGHNGRDPQINFNEEPPPLPSPRKEPGKTKRVA
jgi:antitoxin component of RelBE/YafQ-DinJ toxin-antitoxin module